MAINYIIRNTCCWKSSIS